MSAGSSFGESFSLRPWQRSMAGEVGGGEGDITPVPGNSGGSHCSGGDGGQWHSEVRGAHKRDQWREGGRLEGREGRLPHEGNSACSDAYENMCLLSSSCNVAASECRCPASSTQVLGCPPSTVASQFQRQSLVLFLKQHCCLGVLCAGDLPSRLEGGRGRR